MTRLSKEEFARRFPNQAPPVKAKPRIRQDRSKPNKWEASFEADVRTGYPHSFVSAQSLRLRLGNGCWYKPDVVRVDPIGIYDQVEVIAYEVKGFRRQAGIQAVKVAASLYPWIAFYLVTRRPAKQGGGWSIERVLP